MMRRLVKIRTALVVDRLDLELAAGADPWSSSPLLRRARRLTSADERRRLAAAVEAVAGAAVEHRRSSATRALLRHELVLGYRDELLALAARLRKVRPVEVRLLAELAVLLRDGRSPIYVSGRPAAQFKQFMARCARVRG